MKIFTAALGTETNTFSPVPTSMSSFSDYNLYRPGEHPDRPLEFTAPLWVARQRARSRGWQVIEGTCAGALPAGITVRHDYEVLRDEIIGQIVAAMPLDAVVLSMHGAMVADGYPDCEGDLLHRARAIVGDDVVIGLEIDPHCHLTNKMVESADAIVIFKEYPHIDFLERAEELLDIVEAVVNKNIRPRMSVFDCRMLSIYHTTREPMQGFVNKIQSLEGTDGILSISVAHGFPWGDVAEGGTRILVISDNEQRTGDALAKELGMALFAIRGQTNSPMEDMESAISRANNASAGPIVLADSSDNPGGGAPGDSTFVLKSMLSQGIENACLGAIWDPASVQVAFDAGVGAELSMQIGGKMGATSGKPLDFEVTITGLCRDSHQTFADSSSSLGDCAAIRCGEVDVVLSSIRSQTLGVELFTNVGIDPKIKKIIVVKSSQHFYDAFSPMAAEVIYLDSPGALMQDLKKIPYQNLRKNIWPFVENPFSAGDELNGE